MTRPTSHAVVISGATSGIGLAASTYLASLGLMVYAGYRSEAGHQKLKSLQQPNIHPLALDVSDMNNLQSAAQALSQQLAPGTRLSVLNNAGYVLAGPLECLPLEAVQQQLDTNVMGVLRLSQAFLPLIRQQSQQTLPGRIVNIGSVSGFVALPFMGPYAASKFALRAINDSLRQELYFWKIPVCLIEPGVILTPLWERAFDETTAMRKAVVGHPTAQAYEPFYDPLTQAAEVAQKGGSPVIKVVKTIEHALTAKNPKACYQVGGDVPSLQLLTALPIKLRDALVRMRYGFSALTTD